MIVGGPARIGRLPTGRGWWERCRIGRREFGQIGRGQRAVKAPGVSTTGGAKLSRAVGRRLTKTPATWCSLRSRSRSVPCRRGRVETAGPVQSHPELCDPSRSYWSSPGVALRIGNPALLVLPTPPRLLATDLRAGHSLSLGHCSVSVATRSRPVRGSRTGRSGVTSRRFVRSTKTFEIAYKGWVVCDSAQNPASS
jgi:hypothetical protein